MKSIRQRLDKVVALRRLSVEPLYVVIGFAPSRYGVGLVARASQQHVVNVAQHGGMCAVMVSAQALHGIADAATLIV